MQVDEVRMQHGFPVGKPIEWLEGMEDPVVIPKPSTLPEKSPIYSMEYATFVKISAKDLQELFRAYPVLVVSGRTTRLKCDCASLEEWGGMDELRVMHGRVTLFACGSHLMFHRQFSI